MSSNPTNPTNPTTERSSFFRRILNMGAFRIFLFIIAALITLVALFHAEENWRGARAWRNYRQQQAADKPFDPQALVPPRVADDENFAMTPFLAPLYDYQPGTQIHRNQEVFDRTVTFGDGVPNFPKMRDNDFEVDLVALANELRHPKGPPQPNTVKFKNNPYMAPPFYGKPIQGGDVTDRKEAAQVILNGFSMYSPVIEELRTASHRPYVRFNVAYDNPDKIAILLPHLGLLRRVCRIVSTRATAELALGQTDKALDDVELALYLAEAPKSEAIVISQMVRFAELHEAIQPIIIGLREHQWSDADIQRLQKALDNIDLIAGIRLSLEGETHVFADSCFDQLKAASNPLKLMSAWGMMIGNGTGVDNNPLTAALFYVVVPRGWFDFEQVNYHRLAEQQTGSSIDLERRSVFPEKAAQGDKAIQDVRALGPVHNILHHEVFALVGLPSLSKVAKKTAAAETEVDLTRVACALERHRLAHGQYPDDLNVLSPQFMSTLPHDPINGGPLNYHRTQDGFALYSIGWNGTDDGGKVVPMKERDPRPDPNQGDWVWGHSVNP